MRSIAARPPSSTSVCVTLARNAACVLLNTPMSAMMMSESRATTTMISMSVKAERAAKAGTARCAVRTPQRGVPAIIGI